jgi:hypothetical protein
VSLAFVHCRRSTLIRKSIVTKELAGLFQTLATTNARSIRPVQELAYLALVTAADESDSQVATTQNSPSKAIGNGTSEGSDTTFMTGMIVEPVAIIKDQPEAAAVPVESPETVLGKRSSLDRDQDDEKEPRSDQGAANSKSAEVVNSTSSSDLDLDRPLTPNSRPVVRLRSRSASAMVTVASTSEYASPSQVDAHPGMDSPTKDSEAEAGTSSNETIAVMDVDEPVQPELDVKAPPALPPRSGSMSVNVNMMFGQSNPQTLFVYADLLNCALQASNTTSRNAWTTSSFKLRLLWTKQRQSIRLAKVATC